MWEHEATKLFLPFSFRQHVTVERRSQNGSSACLWPLFSTQLFIRYCRSSIRRSGLRRTSDARNSSMLPSHKLPRELRRIGSRKLSCIKLLKVFWPPYALRLKRLCSIQREST